MHARHFCLILAIVLMTLPLGCGEQSTAIDSSVGIDPSQAVIEIDHDLEDNFFSQNGKSTSGLYRKYFADSVNEHSTGRWQVVDYSGAKKWHLSNTSYSAPKAWLLGGNYWNRESDLLMSNPFEVPGNPEWVWVTFRARWKIAAGDYCQVDLIRGDHLSESWHGYPNWVTTFNGGQNPDYPGWTKYSFRVSRHFEGNISRLDFRFVSNNSGNDWGIGIDDVAVYNPEIGAPQNVSATDGGYPITVSWDHSYVLFKPADRYWIYRSTTSGGSYSEVGTRYYPGNSWVDNTAEEGVTYYYVVRASYPRYGFSDYSNEDSGAYSDP